MVVTQWSFKLIEIRLERSASRGSYLKCVAVNHDFDADALEELRNNIKINVAIMGDTHGDARGAYLKN